MSIDNPLNPAQPQPMIAPGPEPSTPDIAPGQPSTPDIAPGQPSEPIITDVPMPPNAPAPPTPPSPPEPSYNPLSPDPSPSRGEGSYEGPQFLREIRFPY